MAEQMYLIRKGGAYYRPNAQGYTTNVAEAGRYTLDEAIKHGHPNGQDGPRDGITYIPDPTPTPSADQPEGEKGEAVAMTEPQRALMVKLRDVDGYGPVRNMSASDKRMAYALKDRGLLMLDGSIASSVTEGNASYNGMTFVLTDAGLAALQPPTPASGEQMEVVAYTTPAMLEAMAEPDTICGTIWPRTEKLATIPLVTLDAAQKAIADAQESEWHATECFREANNRAETAEALNTTLSEALSVARRHLVTITGGDTSMVPQADQDQIDTALAALRKLQGEKE